MSKGCGKEGAGRSLSHLNHLRALPWDPVCFIKVLGRVVGRRSSGEECLVGPEGGNAEPPGYSLTCATSPVVGEVSKGLPGRRAGSWAGWGMA